MKIGRRIFTIWFHLNPLPFFSRHPSKESSLHRVSSRKCVCPCVRRPHSTNSTSRSLESRKKRCPFILAHLQSLSSSIVIKRGKVATGWRRKRNGKDEKGGQGEWVEVAGQGTQSSGIKPSRLLPTSREFSPFSPSDRSPPLPSSPTPHVPSTAFRCGEKTTDDGVRGRADSIYPRCSSGLIGHFLLSICDWDRQGSLSPRGGNNGEAERRGSRSDPEMALCRRARIRLPFVPYRGPRI